MTALATDVGPAPDETAHADKELAMMRYQGILRAAKCIALDHGGIYRGRSVEQQQKEAHAWIERQPSELMETIDAWLSTLSDEDMELICCDSEDDRAKTLLVDAPPFTDDTLNKYFEEVC